MNIVYLLGIVLAFVFVIFGITFDPGGTGGLMVGPFNLDTLINFVDPTSILIVLGGTLAVVVACYPKLAKSFPKHFKIMLRLDAFNPEQYVDKLTELAQIARKNGLLALEEKAKEQEDPFFQQAIMLIVDANDPDRVRNILENDIEQTSERHQEVIAMYERGSNAAPAFGMIGTLIGLILMLLPSSLFYSISQMTIVFPPALQTLSKGLAIIGAVGILLMSGRSSKNPGLRIALGAYDLYNITGRLSDVLSYSRLLALGLATGVIASVVNQMGSMAGKGIFGAIVFIIVFIIGHVFNLAINLLGAYVHTNRLQYVEFFGKFYEGGGREFHPLRADTKYVDIKEETK